MPFYSEAQRRLQDQFGSRSLADRLEGSIVGDEINEILKGFVESRDFFFLSTVNREGEPTVSYKGGDVGMVGVIDSKTLAFPAYDGNGMFLSMGNIDESAKIGMLFIDFETPNWLRVQATATVRSDDPLLSDYPGAIMIVRATVEKTFLNCARYIHKHTRVSSSSYVPNAAGEQPFPAWKRIDGLQDALPSADQGRAESEGGVITEAEYAVALLNGES